MSALILAAPSSGAGKTTITLGILRALKKAGVSITSAKSGPDYIDPRFHEAACHAPCLNLDAWAMTPERIRMLAAGPGTLIVEGAMGLFDGAPPDGAGSAADLARALGAPVVLVVDAARMAQSAAPLVAGFARHDPRVRLAGVILNKVGSVRHEALLRRALAPLDLPVLGAVPRTDGIAHPSRHLGLVQASERADLEVFLDSAADTLAAHVDLDALHALAAPLSAPARTGARAASRTRPPAQQIALAQDRAFAFAYPHLLADWQAQGAEIKAFSPLANEPVPQADLVILPGGYPELHAGPLAAADAFLGSLAAHAETGAVYGECGGYMVLGDGMIDAAGQRHKMAGLLGLETSFAQRRLHLGYRRLHSADGPVAGHWTGHEFHYAATLKAEGAPLFTAQDAEGTPLPDMGLRRGAVCGSFAHIIDAA